MEQSLLLHLHCKLSASLASPPFSQPSLASPSTSLPLHSKPSQLQSFRFRARQLRNIGSVHASSQPQGPSSTFTEAWVLEPIGDGDSKHIGYKVEMPDTFEIAPQSDVTVGRVPEKAEMVIPVATVSALHARIQTIRSRLYVTDLESTNGTYIDEQPLKPGVATVAAPGSTIIFGDMNLAMFRVSKIKKVEADASESEPEESEDKVEAASTVSVESSE